MKAEKNLLKIFKKNFKLKLSDNKIKLLSNKKLKKWDSLQHLNLILEIEKVFKIKLNFNDIIEAKSFKGLLSILEKKS
jgi:acyl carrier protein